MSHIVRIELQITDLTILEKACKRIGVEFKRDQKQFVWYGQRPEKCDHAIKVPGANYEIGVIKSEEGYELKCDFFDRGIEQKIGKQGGFLKQAYTLEKAKYAALKKGFACKEVKTEKGIQLRIAVR